MSDEVKKQIVYLNNMGEEFDFLGDALESQFSKGLFKRPNLNKSLSLGQKLSLYNIVYELGNKIKMIVVDTKNKKLEDYINEN